MTHILKILKQYKILISTLQFRKQVMIQLSYKRETICNLATQHTLDNLNLKGMFPDIGHLITQTRSKLNRVEDLLKGLFILL